MTIKINLGEDVMRLEARVEELENRVTSIEANQLGAKTLERIMLDQVRKERAAMK